MASNSLLSLSRQIEDSQTDHFSQFYMYCALLRVISSDMSFIDALPETSFPFKNKINKGNLSHNFFLQLPNFKENFNTPPADPLMFSSRWIMNYLRKGQLADLAFITEQMLAHLDAMDEPTQSDNKIIYNRIGFNKNKQIIRNMIESVAFPLRKGLEVLDLSVNSTIALTLALTGLIVALATIPSLIGFLIGTSMLVAASVYCYVNFQKLASLVDTFENEEGSIIQNISNAQNSTSISTQLRNSVYFNSFIKDAVTQPLCEVGFKGLRELAFDNNSSKDIEAYIDNFRQTIN